MKLKTRLYLLKRATRRVFTSEIAKALLYAFYSSLISAVIIGFYFGIYIMGYNAGTHDMANRHETDIPMCAYKDTTIRENPTGYILSDINQGDIVWVVQLQVPFAVVWYFDGANWHLGTTTASYLVPCDRILQESL